MSGSKDVAQRGRSVAAFQRLVALVTALAVLAPSFAWAGTPYSVRWVSWQDAASCATPELETEGVPIFEVNQTPLPTYEVPGAFQFHGDGSESNAFEGAFDSVLLLMGPTSSISGSAPWTAATGVPTRARWCTSSRSRSG
ncbi:hypothetical protein [Sorangium sp. So ce693]|uniref:hypothetical protein n=1 Tax=Sorangium sp. So ce693 TaxID=3133318 RepID=UPI003F63CD4B